MLTEWFCSLRKRAAGQCCRWIATASSAQLKWKQCKTHYSTSTIDSAIEYADRFDGPPVEVALTVETKQPSQSATQTTPSHPVEDPVNSEARCSAEKCIKIEQFVPVPFDGPPASPTLKLDPGLCPSSMQLPTIPGITTQVQDQQPQGVAPPTVPMRPDLASRLNVDGANHIYRQRSGICNKVVCNSQKRRSVDSHSATLTTSAELVAKRQRSKHGNQPMSLTSKGDKQVPSVLSGDAKSSTNSKLVKEVQASSHRNEIAQGVASQEARTSQSVILQWQSRSLVVEPGLWRAGERCCRRGAVS